MQDDIWVRTACNMCLSTCAILVHRADGVVTEIKGDPDHPLSRGKICAKGMAGIMTLYDPNRLLTPMKRTNPQKGDGVDPKWVAISWDEALNILEEKLSKVRREDPRKLTVSTFDTDAIDSVLMGWLPAFGTPNGQWVGYYCGQYLHASMFLTNGTFHCDFDVDYCNYLMLFGNQEGFGAGLNFNLMAQKVAAARKRGMKVVVVDPIGTNAAAKADEWVPIRPGTDGSLVLAIINVLLNDLGIYDGPFIKRHTNGPYLVKPDGYYIRKGGKPLVYDSEDQKVKVYDEDVKDGALEGTYQVDGFECKPAFSALREHVKKYTPEMAAGITTVPAATIRRLAEEWGKEARIGSTIVLDGMTLPYRPVAANIYRGAGSHKHGVAVALTIQLLNMVAGNFYVPGGHRGMNPVGPSWQWEPGEFDGLITPPNEPSVSHYANYYTYQVKSPENSNLRELFPISNNWSPMNIATCIDREKYKLPYKPEVLLICRRNMMLAGVNRKTEGEALKSFAFIAFFGNFVDEVAGFADIVLPEAVYLEKSQAFPNVPVWSVTAATGSWFWGIRQPVVPPAGEARHWEVVLLEMAQRLGFLGELYKKFNVMWGLKEPYLLDPSRTYAWEELIERRLKSKFGDERGFDWFKKNGFVSVKRQVDEIYPLQRLKGRFPLYYENIVEAGKKVQKLTADMGLKEWDVSDYEPLPSWKACRDHAQVDGFDLVAVTYRLATHSQTWTSENPWLSEVAEVNPYAQKVLLNTETAKKMGIKSKDRICIESEAGKVFGEAKVTQCIHPEVVGIASHFGSWADGKPIAKGRGSSFYGLVPFKTDPVSTGVDACVKVKVYKVDKKGI